MVEAEYKEFLANFDQQDTVVFEFHGIVEEPFVQFSNFRASPFELNGQRWPSANHYFQAAKFFGTDDEYSTKIRQADTAFEASRMGKSRQHPIQDNWNEKRDEAMKEAVLAKFTQNGGCRKLLLETGDAVILCHNVDDGYWGDGEGCGGTNLNKLGKLLMEVRTFLRSQ